MLLPEEQDCIYSGHPSPLFKLESQTLSIWLLSLLHFSSKEMFWATMEEAASRAVQKYRLFISTEEV